MQNKYLIIAGSEKCGTTSLFQYLADSNLFVISRSKETDYFRRTEKISLDEYKKEFYPNDSRKIYLEASPGYLSDSHITAGNIEKTLENYHLIFCLRNPLSRLQSSFAFHKSRLYIPKNMEFEEYFDECMNYEKGLPTNPHLSEWCLRVPDCGKYSKHLADFYTANPNSVTLIAFEDIAKAPQAVIDGICSTLSLKTTFYNNYNFKKSNVTTAHKNDKVQKVALSINKSLESFWIKYPKLKQSLLSFYGKLNGAPKEKITISDSLQEKIFEYYKEDLLALRQQESIKIFVDTWIEDLTPKFKNVN